MPYGSLGIFTPLPSAGSIGGRNRIINGDMRIDQANAGASVSVSAAGPIRSVDKWNAVGTAAAGVFTLARSTATPPTGFTNFLRATVTTADASPAAASVYYVEQPIEGYYLQDLGFGAAGALTVAYSFLFRTSLTGTFSAALVNGASNRSYPFQFTVGAANTWQYVSVAIPGDTSGTWATDNTAGMRVRIDLGSGANTKGTALTWAGSNLSGVTGSTNFISTLSATFDITGVQLEAGSVATTFEQRPFGDMLRLCQREYCKSVAVGTAPAQNVGLNTGEHTFPAILAGALNEVSPFVLFPLEMRASPTVTLYNPQAANAQVRDQTGSVDCSAASSAASVRGFALNCTGNAATVVGNRLGVHWSADARL